MMASTCTADSGMCASETLRGLWGGNGNTWPWIGDDLDLLVALVESRLSMLVWMKPVRLVPLLCARPS